MKPELENDFYKGAIRIQNTPDDLLKPHELEEKRAWEKIHASRAEAERKMYEEMKAEYKKRPCNQVPVTPYPMKVIVPRPKNGIDWVTPMAKRYADYLILNHGK